MMRISNGQPIPTTMKALALLGLMLFPLLLTGCDDDDCVTCVEMPPPVVPTGVHSISDDNNVVVQWYDISYYPYDGDYNPNVVTYVIYSRYFVEGDQYDPDREFVVIGEVDWDENFDPYSGLHWFNDFEAMNGERYEYAVSAVNAAGEESALSYELVTDAPLPMGLDGTLLFAANAPTDPNSSESGFDFSDLESDAVDPWAVGSTYDFRVTTQGDVLYAQTGGSALIQDYGMFVDGDGYLVFEGVSWAPTDYYSSTGTVELILGHVYVLEVVDNGVHYAKFGVVDMGTNWVEIIWAYQTIEGLPELKAPPEPDSHTEHRRISL